MATSTTNYGLTKPAYNESADVAVINTNMDTIDEVMGKNQTAATGAQKAIAIVADGDTHVAITVGQYVYVKNNTHSLAEGLYTASTNVSANANITGSNMTAVSGGGLNAIFGNIPGMKTAIVSGTSNASLTVTLNKIAIIVGISGNPSTHSGLWLIRGAATLDVLQISAGSAVSYSVSGQTITFTHSTGRSTQYALLEIATF